MTTTSPLSSSHMSGQLAFPVVTSSSCADLPSRLQRLAVGLASHFLLILHLPPFSCRTLGMSCMSAVQGYLCWNEITSQLAITSIGEWRSTMGDRLFDAGAILLLMRAIRLQSGDSGDRVFTCLFGQVPRSWRMPGERFRRLQRRMMARALMETRWPMALMQALVKRSSCDMRHGE